MTSAPHVVSFVFNKVEGDSRVIKTAQAAIDAGYRATIVGVGAVVQAEWRTVEGVQVRILPNFSTTLKGLGIWGAGRNRDLRLLIGGQVGVTTAEIVSLEPDILHSHDMIGLKVGAAAWKALVASGRKVPWVHDLHEFVAGLKGDLAEQYMPICLGWEREFLHQAGGLITVSDALAKRVHERYHLSEPPKVIYNTPVKGSFSDGGLDIRSILGLAPEVPLVVFVGGATALRGCPTIVEAVSKLPAVHLVFVSEGAYVDEMKKLADSLGMTDRFHTHPFVESDKVTSLIRTADVGIHGLVHYPNAEVALPNKLFEYIHARLPVVLSDVESMRAFVTDHCVGTCFAAEDAESCAGAIAQALDRKDEFRAAITDDLLNTYSWERQAEKIAGVYGSLLAKSSLSTLEERKQAAEWDRSETTMFEAIFSRSLAEKAARTVPPKPAKPKADPSKNEPAKIIPPKTSPVHPKKAKAVKGWKKLFKAIQGK